MTKKDYFIIGCKLLSIYCFILGIPSIFNAVATFFVVVDVPPELKTTYFFGNLVMRLTPVFLLGSGIYLMKRSEIIYEFSYDEKQEEKSVVNTGLLLAIKISGLFLIIHYTPDLMQTISSFISYKTAPPIFELLQQQRHLYSNGFSSIFGVLFGFYLLKDGSVFLNFGVNDEENKQ